MGLLRILNYVFGSEEIIDRRRQLVLLREKLLNQRSSPYRYLSSGSLGEGVSFPKSDDDQMTFRVGYRVLNSIPKNNCKGEFLMVDNSTVFCSNNRCRCKTLKTSELSAGYCLLIDVANTVSAKLVHVIVEMPIVSSSLLKKRSKKPGEFIHGPCLSHVHGSFRADHTTCLECPFWPKDAHEWKERNRSYGWPSTEMIQSIIQSGCHVVPIGNPDSEYGEHEWRISFSFAERMLVNSFNHAQFLTYNVLRYALKKVINKQIPDVLCSYFMKTTLFHTIERTSRRMWNVDNLEICYRVCLAVLYNFIHYINCPNFFIPKYNMIKRKVNDKNKQQLLDLIRYLISKGILGLLDVYMSLSNIDERTYSMKFEARQDLEFFRGYHFRLTIAALRRFFLFSIDGEESYASLITKIMHCLHELKEMMAINHEYREIILLEGISCSSHILMNRFWSSNEHHKQKYYLHKATVKLLRELQMGGLTSGKLTIASYMYLIGKTESALSVIRQVLSEYPPYDLNISDLVQKDCRLNPYCEQMCGKGYTLHYKTRSTWELDLGLLSSVQNAFPSPLKIWISIHEIVTLNPLEYGLVLESLCHIRLQDKRPLMKCIRRLVHHISVFGSYGNANLKMCVGIILCAAGDNRSANTCFEAAKMMREKLVTPFNKRISCSALAYIACLKFKEGLKSGGNRKPRFQLPQRYPKILWICTVYFILLYSLIYYLFIDDMCFDIEVVKTAPLTTLL